mmetsp:Transcript_26993/g.84893  ORF Transcript_26993/g.84893 Transcript_26993/m.84893 type:complete len:557 (+) Transcript_26993:359-2029(+)
MYLKLYPRLFPITNSMLTIQNGAERHTAFPPALSLVWVLCAAAAPAATSITAIDAAVPAAAAAVAATHAKAAAGHAVRRPADVGHGLGDGGEARHDHVEHAEGELPRVELRLEAVDLVDGVVDFEQVLAAVRVARREEVREEPLDEAEHEHVAHGRERDDEDDHEGDEGEQVLEGAPQRAHLARLERVVRRRRARHEAQRVLHVVEDDLRAERVEPEAFAHLLREVGEEVREGAPLELDAEVRVREAQAHHEVAHLHLHHRHLGLVHGDARRRLGLTRYVQHAAQLRVQEAELGHEQALLRGAHEAGVDLGHEREGSHLHLLIERGEAELLARGAHGELLLPQVVAQLLGVASVALRRGAVRVHGSVPAQLPQLRRHLVAGGHGRVVLLLPRVTGRALGLHLGVGLGGLEQLQAAQAAAAAVAAGLVRVILPLAAEAAVEVAAEAHDLAARAVPVHGAVLAHEEPQQRLVARLAEEVQRDGAELAERLLLLRRRLLEPALPALAEQGLLARGRALSLRRLGVGAGGGLFLLHRRAGVLALLALGHERVHGLLHALL